MTANQYEHYLVFVEEVERDGETQMGLTAVAVDLSPESPVTMRQLSTEELGDDLPAYVNKSRGSMQLVCDRMVEQVLMAQHDSGSPIPYNGFIDLTEQFQAAPHLLLANMLAAMVSAAAQAATAAGIKVAP